MRAKALSGPYQKEYAVKKFASLAVAAASAASLSACSLAGTTHQSSQAGATDHSAAQVIQMPSGFRNFAIKCVNVQGEWFAVATTSDGGNDNNIPAGMAMAPDPKCVHYGP